MTLNSNQMLALLIVVILAWASISVLVAVRKLNRTYQMEANRFLYPASCKPECCKDIAGFVRFITPRMVGFGVTGLVLCVFLLCSEIFGLLSFLPEWLSKRSAFVLFLPLFIWYAVFINKAAKRFW